MRYNIYMFMHSWIVIHKGGETNAMDLLQLRYFRIVARLEHMTQAAQELYISQSSLSKTIAHLERELGVSLFNRQGRQIQLNQYGKAFLRRGGQGFSSFGGGQREPADLSKRGEGRRGPPSVSAYSPP